MAKKVYCPHCGTGFVPAPRKRRVQKATTTKEVKKPTKKPDTSGVSPEEALRRKFDPVKYLIE